MTRFNTKIAAGVLAGLGLVYMVASLATGRSASAESPPDLGVEDSQVGIGIWQTASLLIRDKGNLEIVDIRSAKDYARYHVPGSRREPDANTSKIAELAGSKKIVIVASKDEQAIALVTAARSSSGRKNVFYLKGGARSFYLTFELPVPLFSDKEVPFGYEKALSVVKAHIGGQGKRDVKDVQDALATLVRLGYEPTALKKSGKPRPQRRSVRKYPAAVAENRGPGRSGSGLRAVQTVLKNNFEHVHPRRI